MLSAPSADDAAAAVPDGSGESACVLCGGCERGLIVVGYDRMAARAEHYEYRRCVACGLVAQRPLPAENEIPGFYPADYYDRVDSWTRNLDKPINRVAIRWFYGVDSVTRPRPVRAVFRLLSGRILRGVCEPYGQHRLLDVGCGSGSELDVHRRLGWQTVGIEVDAGAVERARRRGLAVHHGTVFDAPFGAEFDVVLLSHVIEHVRDPVALLARAGTFLAPRGKLIIRTPNVRSLGFRLYGSCWYGLDAPRHVMLFSPSTLRAAAAQAGLIVRRLRTTAEPRLLCASRHVLRTQGRRLPDDLAERRRRLEQSNAVAPRRGVVLHLAAAASLASTVFGKGELLEAELTLGERTFTTEARRHGDFASEPKAG